jgi:hypothetical protein
MSTVNNHRVHRAASPSPPRVSLPDRIAMRIGLALLVWGRRHSAAELRSARIERADVRAARIRARRQLLVVQRQDEQARELQWEALAQVLGRWR